MLAGPMPNLQYKLVTCDAIYKIKIEKQLREFSELEECTLGKKAMSIDSINA